MKKTVPDQLAKVIFFSLIFLVNALALFIHNRLNAFLYVLLLLIYILLYSPSVQKHPNISAGINAIFFDFSTSQAVLSWFFCIFAPNLLALYYLDFGLLLTNFLLDILLTGCLFYLKKKE